MEQARPGEEEQGSGGNEEMGRWPGLIWNEE